MFFLLLAILSSSMVSIIMRLSTEKVKNNVAMLVMNYLMCVIIAGAYTGAGNLFPRDMTLPTTLGMGAVNGFLYLASFVLLQLNMKKNGVVLSATFMKLGLLVPMLISVFFFGEKPAFMQILGFVTATAAIILINLEKERSQMNFKINL